MFVIHHYPCQENNIYVRYATLWDQNEHDKYTKITFQVEPCDLDHGFPVEYQIIFKCCLAHTSIGYNQGGILGIRWYEHIYDRINFTMGYAVRVKFSCLSNCAVLKYGFMLNAFAF